MATWPESHILFRTGGHFGTSASPRDYWSVGLRLSPGPPGNVWDGTKLQTFVTAANLLVRTFHQTAGVDAGSNCWHTYSTAAVIGEDGFYEPKGAPTARSDTTPVAGTGTTALPFNTAGVFSLRTENVRGLASNGRVYYPWTAVVIDNVTGVVPGITVGGRVASFKTLLDGINSLGIAYSPGTRVRVMSQGGISGGPVSAPVLSIRSDGRLDSQERRENDQPSVWSSVTLA